MPAPSPTTFPLSRLAAVGRLDAVPLRVWIDTGDNDDEDSDPYGYPWHSDYAPSPPHDVSRDSIDPSTPMGLAACSSIAANLCGVEPMGAMLVRDAASVALHSNGKVVRTWHRSWSEGGRAPIVLLRALAEPLTLAAAVVAVLEALCATAAE